MAGLDQTSTPRFKRCSKCGEVKSIDEFPLRNDGGSKDGHRNQCNHCLYLKRKPYKQSTKGKENDKRYKQSDKGKASQKRGNWNYRNGSPEKIVKFRQWFNEYMRNWRAIHGVDPNRAQKDRQRYYCLQDKYGCHTDVRDWYPAARLIEALETAPIVEIKG